MKSETFIRVAQLSELTGDGPFALSANEADIVLVKSRAVTGARSKKAVVQHQARAAR